MKIPSSFSIACVFALAAVLSFSLSRAEEKPNILIITVDDMSCDSIGVFGAKLDGTSPHVDQLAKEGLRFEYAHVQVGNCYPSRNVMWSGLYSHNNGAEGFYQVKPIDYPVLYDTMSGAGYYTAIRGKVSHSTPYTPFQWDDDLTVREDGTKENIKDVESYNRSTARGIAKAKELGKPFCLNINISDPHKPFWKPGDKHPASHEFTAKEVPVPGFLPDDPVIREELALYYTSVRRADDCVGAILQALDDSGEREDTFVMFLSDHGMPLPFAKTQLYHHSTRTPLIIRWPGVTEADSVDSLHMVSAVDFMPTLCDVIGIEHPNEYDGKSFAPLLRGKKQPGRTSVFKLYNENSGGNRHPIRAIETKDYLYLYNPWSDGTNRFRTATQGTESYKRLQELAETEEYIAERLRVFDHRDLEELYHVATDPDCINNLIDSVEHAAALEDLRTRLRRFMKQSNDHVLEPFAALEDEAIRLAYMERVSAEANQRREKKRKQKRANQENETGNKRVKKNDQ